jgi:NAD(P)-dependent dehydrogenase (short-subunit alcohol dehydrogenase family)
MKEVALITGGSRGIGRGIALALAERGFDLLLNFRGNSEAAAQTSKECVAKSSGKIRAEIFQSDISLENERTTLLDFLKEQFGRLDLLVNNAGVAPSVRADVLETSEESFERVMGTNVNGPFFLTQAAAKWMLELKGKLEEEYRPKIVTISSISAYTASLNRAEYCISKAALSMITPLFASRLAREGILVYEVRPGIIATEMTAGVKEKYDELIAQDLTPIARWGTPEDIGAAVAAIAENRFPFSTGEVFNVDGGFHLRRL